MAQVRETLRALYLGDDRTATIFQLGLLAFDLATVAFFVAMGFTDPPGWIVRVEVALAVFIALDFAARLTIAWRKLSFLLAPSTLADLIVLVSLLTPLVGSSLAFLRIMRATRLFRAYHVLALLRRRFACIRRNEETAQAVANLLVFVFFTSSCVYVLQAPANPAIDDYVDALYFTVTTLTTTGFGDITLVGEYGRLLAVLIMIFGVSLFLRLAQTVFRPGKVVHPCPHCGLRRHDQDAVHCKHCGELLDIPTEGLG